MRRERTLYEWVAVSLIAVALSTVGCGTTYDGSGGFYDQHPEYSRQPGYFTPNDLPSQNDAGRSRF